MGKKYDELQVKRLICHWKHQPSTHKLELTMKILKINMDGDRVSSVTL